MFLFLAGVLCYLAELAEAMLALLYVRCDAHSDVMERQNVSKWGSEIDQKLRYLTDHKQTLDDI